jgi:RNA polymerase sigma-54 factor
VGGVREERDDREHYEPVTIATRGLDDHLRDQVRLLDLSEREELLADEFIGNINEDGWLACVADEILTGINNELKRAAEAADVERELPLFTMPEAERMLRTIQALDPPASARATCTSASAAAARTRAGRDALGDARARALPGAHRASLGGDRPSSASRQGEVQTAADAIAKLNPKPGRAYAEGGDNYVVPDLIVEKVEGNTSSSSTTRTCRGSS